MIHQLTIHMDTPTDDNHMHQLLARIVPSAMMYNSDTSQPCSPQLCNFVKMNLCMGAFKGSHLPGIRVETHTNPDIQTNMDLIHILMLAIMQVSVLHVAATDLNICYN